MADFVYKYGADLWLNQFTYPCLCYQVRFIPALCQNNIYSRVGLFCVLFTQWHHVKEMNLP